MSRIIVSGANGFVGRELCRTLSDNQFEVYAVVRNSINKILAEKCFVVRDLVDKASWENELVGVDCVIHLAARVHIMKDTADDPYSKFKKMNVDATMRLAHSAVDAGVKRFIYVSSIKVNGEETSASQVFKADDTPNPIGPYALSKLQAEKELLELSTTSELEVVVIRPPLVYSPGVKANFMTMMRWLDKGIPLPLGAVHNKRSFVALDNLVDLIMICINHPAAANEIFLVSDGEDLSTTELLKRTAKALNKPARLIPVSASLLKFLATLLGKRDVAMRLFGSLQVDIEKTRKLLDWEPPVSIDDALKMTAEEFLRSN